MTEKSDLERARFEQWISAPPYERTVKRFGEQASWPGQYLSLDIQLAWEAWQEALRVRGETDQKVKR